jgi:HPt (histidine-containing phosphotransfer) domain-containing protein
VDFSLKINTLSLCILRKFIILDIQIILQINMPINFENFEKLTMGDEEFARDLLQIYIKELEQYANEVDAFLHDKDLPKFRLKNHDLRSVVKTLSLESVIDLQEKLKSSVIRNLSKEELHIQGEEMKKILRDAISELKKRL